MKEVELLATKLDERTLRWKEGWGFACGVVEVSEWVCLGKKVWLGVKLGVAG